MYALRITIAIVLFSSIALAQQAKISAATCSEPAEKLLEQSYRISADFPIEERAMYLTTLSSRAAELHSPNTGTWARELWSSTDPAQANALAAQLTEPDLRISAYSAIAASLPASEHSRAADLLRSQFREAHKIENPGRRLTAYLGLARAAKASGETQITRDAIRSGLDSGEEAFAEERDIHPSELTYRMLPFRELAWLVELCAQTDPEWIVPHLHTMDDPALQAYLLLSAGKGLYERECTPTEH